MYVRTFSFYRLKFIYFVNSLKCIVKSSKSESDGFIKAINLDKLVLNVTSGSYQEFLLFLFCCVFFLMRWKSIKMPVKLSSFVFKYKHKWAQINYQNHFSSVNLLSYWNTLFFLSGSDIKLLQVSFGEKHNLSIPEFSTCMRVTIIHHFSWLSVRTCLQLCTCIVVLTWAVWNYIISEVMLNWSRA